MDFLTFGFLLVDDILESVKSDYNKWVTHGKQHPDIDHLDVGSRGEGMGDSDKAENVRRLSEY